MSSMDGESTVLTPATSKGRSLRTTVPMSIVKQFGLKPGDLLSWKMKAQGNEILIIVKLLKKSEKNLEKGI